MTPWGWWTTSQTAVFPTTRVTIAAHHLSDLVWTRHWAHLRPVTYLGKLTLWHPLYDYSSTCIHHLFIGFQKNLVSINKKACSFQTHTVDRILNSNTVGMEEDSCLFIHTLEPACNQWPENTGKNNSPLSLFPFLTSVFLCSRLGDISKGSTFRSWDKSPFQ